MARSSLHPVDWDATFRRNFLFPAFTDQPARCGPGGAQLTQNIWRTEGEDPSPSPDPDDGDVSVDENLE